MGGLLESSTARAAARLLPFVWMAVIFAFSSIQNPRVTDEVLLDLVVKKVGHFVIYGVLAFLLAVAVATTRWRARAVFAALVIAVGFAVSDEIHQVFTPSRGPSVVDVAIDALGAFVGVRAFEMLRPRPPERVGRVADQSVGPVAAE